MTWLTALLPVKEGVAAYAALTRAADSARAQGDPRSRGQVMADTLVASVAEGFETPLRRSATSGGLALNLVMSHTAPFGTSDEPAYLDSYGTIPAELAREIVAGACAANETIWLQRLFTSPDSGELAAMDSRARVFPASLARFIRLRDQTCRTPWCDAPIRHADHVTPRHRGGPTSIVNGQGLCEACNQAKEAAGWTAQSAPDEPRHSVDINSPTGLSYRSRAPALARILNTHVTIDYVLAG